MNYKTVIKYLTTSFAVFMVLGGIIMFWIPIPVGAIMMGVGFSLLMTESRTFTKYVRSLRSNYAGFNDLLHTLQAKLPTGLRKVLEKSDPDLRY